MDWHLGDPKTIQSRRLSFSIHLEKRVLVEAAGLEELGEHVGLAGEKLQPLAVRE